MEDKKDFSEHDFILGIHDNYKSDTRLFVNYCITQDLPLNIESLDDWIQYLRYNGYSASTIKKRFYAIKTRLRLVLQTKVFENEDARTLELYNLERKSRAMKVPRRATFNVKPTKFFTENEIKELIQKSEQKTAVMIEFLYTTGVRIAEMVNIRKRSVRQESPVVYSIRILGKGSKERIVFINSGLRRRIQDSFSGDEWLFETSTNTPYDERNVWRKLRTAGKKVLGKILTPHCLRHSFTAHKIRSTGKITGVSLYLGHSDIATTLGEYNNELLNPEELTNGLWGDRGRKKNAEQM